MKQALPWLVAVGCAGLSVGVLLRSQPNTTAPFTAPLTNAAIPTAVPEGKAVHTFSDEAAMEAFAKLWQQHQGSVVRMALLQSYWNNEQASLAKLDATFSSQYGIDTKKNYFLDAKQRVVMERETPATPATPAAATDTPAPATPPAQEQPPTGKAVHTFANDDEMKAFSEQWQQRQIIVLRMTVLQNYWDQEQVSLTALNKKLETEYQVDPAKNYFLDGQRRQLIEREAPPQAAPANAPQPGMTPPSMPPQPAAPQPNNPPAATTQPK